MERLRDRGEKGGREGSKGVENRERESVNVSYLGISAVKVVDREWEKSR